MISRSRLIAALAITLIALVSVLLGYSAMVLVGRSIRERRSGFVLKCLTDRDWELCFWLSHEREYERDYEPHVLRFWRSSDQRVARTAALVLLSSGRTEPLADVVDGLRNEPDPTYRSYAVGLIARFADESFEETILSGLKDISAAVRADTLQNLSAFYNRHGMTCHASLLSDMLHEQDRGVKVAALGAIKTIERLLGPEAVLEQVKDIARDNSRDWPLQFTARRALRRLERGYDDCGGFVSGDGVSAPSGRFRGQPLIIPGGIPGTRLDP